MSLSKLYLSLINAYGAMYKGDPTFSLRGSQQAAALIAKPKSPILT